MEGDDTARADRHDHRDADTLMEREMDEPLNHRPPSRLRDMCSGEPRRLRSAPMIMSHRHILREAALRETLPIQSCKPCTG